MQLTVADLFWAITLPLIITFIGIMVAFVMTYLSLSDKLSGLSDKLGGLSDKVGGLREPLARIEINTARIPAIEVELGRIIGAMQRQAGHQSVAFKLPKTGMEAIVHITDRAGDSTTIEIDFDKVIMQDLAESTATEVARNVTVGPPNETWPDIEVVLSILVKKAIALPKAALVTVLESDPIKVAAFIKQFLDTFDRVQSEQQSWASSFENELKKKQGAAP